VSIAGDGQHGHDQSNPREIHSEISIRVRVGPVVMSPGGETPSTAEARQR
jgi:hypothetical protein